MQRLAGLLTAAAPLVVGLATARAVPAQEPAAESKGFQDPAPPSLRKLESVDPPEPADFPGHRFHAPPRPLAEDAVTEDWPCFLGPRRDAHSRETRLAKSWGADGPPLVWEVERGQGYASPVVAEGRLVFTHRVGDESIVECLEPETGERFWRFAFPCDYRDRYIGNHGPRSTPAISEGRVYVHGVQGRLFCLELATGRVIWQRDLDEELGTEQGYFGVVSSPLVVGDLLIQQLGAPGGPTVAAFDKRTGRIVWGAGTEWGASCSSPVLATVHGRERLFVLAGGDSRPPTGGLMVLDPADGTIDLTYPFRSKTYESVNGAAPAVDGDRVFLTASYGVGSACLRLAEDGGFRELWKDRHVGIQFANPLFHDGLVHVIDGLSGRAGAAVCIDPETGAERARTDLYWEETVTLDGEEKTLSFSPGEASLLWADGSFLCLGDSGHLMWLDLSAKGARVLARAWLFGASESWTPPVISRGLLYVCQNNRERFGDSPPRLLCYDLRAAE